MVTGDPADPRELVGRLVRQVWIEWASEQDDPKPSWLLPWEDLDDGQREVDMRIGEKLYQAGGDALTRKIKRLRDAEDRQFQADMDLLDYALRGEPE
jgi:hypothetical protein